MLGAPEKLINRTQPIQLKFGKFTYDRFANRQNFKR